MANADWLVVGTVREIESQWNADHSQIYTLVNVAVEEWVKGELRGKEIVINKPGGTVGEITQQVEDVPSFRVGEMILVFLKLHDGGTIGVVGGWQGKFVVQNARIVGTDLSLADMINQIKTLSSKGGR